MKAIVIRHSEDKGGKRRQKITASKGSRMEHYALNVRHTLCPQIV